MSGKIDKLAFKKIPKVFAKLQAKGLCDLAHFVYLDWADDDKGGRDKRDLNRTATPVPARFESKVSSRQDESGVWSSYTKSTVIFPLFHDSSALEIKLTDKLKRLATETKPEVIFEIKTLSRADAYYELVVEEDVRSGQRVQGA